MAMRAAGADPPGPQFTRDFWKFWLGQTISTLGSSFTGFAVPLLIFKLTGSALNLALATVAATLPNLLFGLPIGAWVDRVDRKRLMLGTNLAQAAVIASIPLLAASDRLAIGWVYAVGFLGATLGLCFMTAQAAALPSLIPATDLVTANGRIQASLSAAGVAGPVLAGLLVTVLPIEALLLVDAASFLVSAASLALIRRGFNAVKGRPGTSLGQDIAAGLRYIATHPVLRALAVLNALLNLVITARTAQLVLLAKERLGASDAQVGLLFSATSLGIVVFSLAAGRLRRHASFGQLVLGAAMLNGVLTIALALIPWYWVALPLWGLSMGVLITYNINLAALRQALVPDHLLGRVASALNVLSGAALPAGALLGGLLIERTRNVALLFGVSGAAGFLIALAFAFTALREADRYLSGDAAPGPRRTTEAGGREGR